MVTTISIPIRIKLSFGHGQDKILEATITTDSLYHFLRNVESCLEIVRKQEVNVTDLEYSLNYKEDKVIRKC